MTIKYPKTLAACQYHKLAELAIGDALIEEIGETERDAGDPCATAFHNGSYAKLLECAAELESFGLDYNVKYLARLRKAATNFPPETRKPGVKTNHYIDAKTPENLAIAMDKHGPTLTQKQIREVVKDIEGRACEDRDKFTPARGKEGLELELTCSFIKEIPKLRDKAELIRYSLDKLSPKFIDALAEQCRLQARWFDEFADELKPIGTKLTRGDLRVVKG